MSYIDWIPIYSIRGGTIFIIIIIIIMPASRRRKWSSNTFSCHIDFFSGCEERFSTLYKSSLGIVISRSIDVKRQIEALKKLRFPVKSGVICKG